MAIVRTVGVVGCGLMGSGIAQVSAQAGLTTWVRELAAATHGFYHDCHVMGDGVSPELTQARLWLVEAAEIGLAIGLDLLGVDAPESM